MEQVADVGVSAKKVRHRAHVLALLHMLFYTLRGFTGFYLTSLPSTLYKVQCVHVSAVSWCRCVVCGVGESYNYANFKGKAQLSRVHSELRTLVPLQPTLK